MRERLLALRSDLTGEQLDRFALYFDMLIDWNARVNLTAITDKTGVASKHFIDSLAAAPYLPKGARVIDVGTGAGFPGVPLLILRPDIKLTLLDGLNKRLVFLRALLDALNLQADCVHMRAEDAGRDARYRERFDAAVTRAVAALPVIAELTLPLIKVGGVSVAYKGSLESEAADAQNALHALHASLSCMDVSAGYGARTLALMQKHAPTPTRYPRKAGTPAKNPL